MAQWLVLNALTNFMEVFNCIRNSSQISELAWVISSYQSYGLIRDPALSRLGSVLCLWYVCVRGMRRAGAEAAGVCRILLLWGICARWAAPLRTRTANLSANTLWLRGITADRFLRANCFYRFELLVSVNISVPRVVPGEEKDGCFLQNKFPKWTLLWKHFFT